MPEPPEPSRPVVIAGEEMPAMFCRTAPFAYILNVKGKRVCVLQEGRSIEEQIAALEAPGAVIVKGGAHNASE